MEISQDIGTSIVGRDFSITRRSIPSFGFECKLKLKCRGVKYCRNRRRISPSFQFELKLKFVVRCRVDISK